MAHRPGDRAALLEGLTRDLEARPEIVFAVLHGSFQTGGPARDRDVAVWVDPRRVPQANALRYAIDVGASLPVRFGLMVDVQVLNYAPLAFRYRGLKGTPLVVRDMDLYDDVRARTWDDYFDFEPFARRYLREALGA